MTQALPPRTQSRSVSKETSTSTSPTLVKPTPVAASSSKSVPVVSTKDELKSSSPTKAIPTNSIPLSSSSLATSLSHIVMKPTPISNTTVHLHTTVDNKPHKDEGEEESHFPSDSCNNGDCDNNGSGLLIGLVIGSVFFLLIALSVAAIIHKLHQNRKKKHYHNVDYLINGMYS